MKYVWGKMDLGLVSHYTKSFMGKQINASAVNLCYVCLVFFVVLHVVKACLKESNLDLSGMHAFSSCMLE